MSRESEFRFAPSLSAVLAATAFAGIFLLAGILMLVEYHTQRLTMREDIRMDAYNLANSLRHPVQALLIRQDHGALSSILQSVASDRRVRYVLLIDRTHRIVASYRSDLVG